MYHHLASLGIELHYSDYISKKDNCRNKTPLWTKLAARGAYYRTSYSTYGIHVIGLDLHPLAIILGCLIFCHFSDNSELKKRKTKVCSRLQIFVEIILRSDHKEVNSHFLLSDSIVTFVLFFRLRRKQNDD